MTFPLGEWIDRHADCRHNLGISGMHAAVPTPRPTAGDVQRADEGELRRRLAEDLGVRPGRVFLTTGASSANSLILLFLARFRKRGPPGAVRVCLPEYPPLLDAARWAGFRPAKPGAPAELAVVSQPRNPEGDLWERTRLLDWASGTRWLLVDETFREFAGTPSALGTNRPGLFATGSFTKFYAGDDLRVGFALVPEEAVTDFGRFHGVVTNALAPYSVAGATRALRDREKIRRQVLDIVNSNISVARSAFPNQLHLRSPVMFDRPESGEMGDSLASRALAASVLVCSGSFFGDPSGVRLCLTRRSFPADLAAYLSVRARPPAQRRSGRGPKLVTGRDARRPPGGSGRAKASPS